MLKSYIRINKDNENIVVLERTSNREVYSEKWRVETIEQATKKLEDYEFLVGNCLMLLSVGDKDRLVGRKFKAKSEYRDSEDTPVLINKGDKLRVVGTQQYIDTSSRIAYSVSNETTNKLITILENRLMPIIV